MRTTRIDPGSLRRRLTLESCETTADGAGGHHRSWAAVATVFARVEPIAAKAGFGAGQELQAVSHRVTLRHRDDLTAAMRFTDGARVFSIVSVCDPDETGRYLECRTVEEEP